MRVWDSEKTKTKYMFCIGIHNIDLSMNFQKISFPVIGLLSIAIAIALAVASVDKIKPRTCLYGS